MIHSKYEICEARTIPWEKYDGKIDMDLMRKRVRCFIEKRDKARVLTLNEVKRKKTAYFEMGQPDPHSLVVINLSNILTEYEVTDQELTAVRVFMKLSNTVVEKIRFPVENYGSTWRCWSAVPTEEQIRNTEW